MISNSAYVSEKKEFDGTTRRYRSGNTIGVFVSFIAYVIYVISSDTGMSHLLSYPQFLTNGNVCFAEN